MIPLEIAIILIGLVGGLGFCIGSYISPVNKHLKNHIRFLEGKVNRYKQDMQETKKESADWFDEIADQYPMLKPFKGQAMQILTNIQKDPTKLQELLGGNNQNTTNKSNNTTWR